MRLLVLVVLFASPLAAAQSVEEVHVTLWATAEDAVMEPMRVSGLFVHWSTAESYDQTAAPQVVYRIGDGAEQTIPAAQVGRPSDGPFSGEPMDRLGVRAVYGAHVPAAPGETVTYRVGEPEAGMSQERNITMPPSDSLRVVAYADIGYDGITNGDEPMPLRVMDLALAQDPDLTIIPGDLAYHEDAARWQQWLAAMEPSFSTVPVMPVPGNHETDRDYHLFKEYFEVPRSSAGDNLLSPAEQELERRPEEYFSFQAGPAYFVGLNSDGVCRDRVVSGVPASGEDVPPCEGGGAPDFTQYDWLHDTLEDAREEIDPAWLIVYFHHPPYSWSAHGDDAAVKELWVPLLETYQVDLVVTGHEHVYERTFPLTGGVPVQEGDTYRSREGVTYVVTGGGGRSLYDIKPEPYPSWWAAGQEVHHVTVIDITNETISVQALEAHNGTVIDSFSIHHPASEAYPSKETAAPAGEDSPWPVVLVLIAVVGAAWGVRRRPQD